MRAADVGEVRPLLVGGEARADALLHQQHQRAVAKPQPILAPDQLDLAVARERVFLKAVERRTVEAGHRRTSSSDRSGSPIARRRPDRYSSRSSGLRKG